MTTPRVSVVQQPQAPRLRSPRPLENRTYRPSISVQGAVGRDSASTLLDVQQQKLYDLQQRLRTLQTEPPQELGPDKIVLATYIDAVAAKINALDMELRVVAGQCFGQEPRGQPPPLGPAAQSAIQAAQTASAAQQISRLTSRRDQSPVERFVSRAESMHVGRFVSRVESPNCRQWSRHVSPVQRLATASTPHILQSPKLQPRMMEEVMAARAPTAMASSSPRLSTYTTGRVPGTLSPRPSTREPFKATSPTSGFRDIRPGSPVPRAVAMLGPSASARTLGSATLPATVPATLGSGTVQLGTVQRLEFATPQPTLGSATILGTPQTAPVKLGSATIPATPQSAPLGTQKASFPNGPSGMPRSLSFSKMGEPKPRPSSFDAPQSFSLQSPMYSPPPQVACIPGGLGVTGFNPFTSVPSLGPVSVSNIGSAKINISNGSNLVPLQRRTSNCERLGPQDLANWKFGVPETSATAARPKEMPMPSSASKSVAMAGPGPSKFLQDPKTMGTAPQDEDNDKDLSAKGVNLQKKLASLAAHDRREV